MSPAPPYSQLEVLPLDGNRRAWDELVTRAKCGSFCHLAGWREILSDVLGAECLYWQVVDADGALQGILPLVRVRSRIFGHYLVSLPFLNYGGPLGSQAAQDRLVQEAMTEAARTRADLLELRTRDPGGFDLPVSSRKITVLLPLPSDAETLFTRFPAKLRSQIDPSSANRFTRCSRERCGILAHRCCRARCLSASRRRFPISSCSAWCTAGSSRSPEAVASYGAESSR